MERSVNCAEKLLTLYEDKDRWVSLSDVPDQLHLYTFTCTCMPTCVCICVHACVKVLCILQPPSGGGSCHEWS